MSKILASILIALLFFTWSEKAKALMNFEVVGWGRDFVAFTVSGDFTGYANPPTSSTLFSIVYDGDLWAGPSTFANNTWTPGSGPFTRIQVVNPGGTGLANGIGFSFIQYADRLSNGSIVTANNQPVIVRFASARLNTSAANPVFHFVWGSGGLENTLLDTWPDPANGTPALTLDKSADVTTFSAVNDVINYEYLVTSSGTGPVAGPISVTDDKVTVTCPAVDTVGNNDDNLDPAESLTCTASHTVVQADIDATVITNRASAEGDAGATVSNEDTVSVTYEAVTYSVSASVAAGNGSVSCNPTSVAAGGSSTCTAVPDAGNQVSGWTGACAAAGTSTTCTLDNIQADQSSTVSFEAIPAATFSVTATVASGDGSVDCVPGSVTAGGSSTCTAVPDAGNQVSAWTGACAAAGTSTTCTLDNIQADQSSTVSFEVIPLNVVATVAAGNGTVSCDPASVPPGGSSTCTAVPDAGYQVSAWTGACAAAGTSTTCALDNILADQAVTVTFDMSPVPPLAEAEPVPALSRWGLALLGLLLVGFVALRHRW